LKYDKPEDLITYSSFDTAEINADELFEEMDIINILKSVLSKKILEKSTGILDKIKTVNHDY